MRAAVVGHVEWIEFARVGHVPAPGEIVHASETWEEPGGGGAVAAVQLAKLADGGATLFTALGDDDLGHQSQAALEALGLRVEAVFRPEPQRRGFVHVDDRGERTITVIGDRLGPRGDDPLPWAELERADAVYFTAGDATALRHARAARKLVATPRGRETLIEAGVKLDALVASSKDPGEQIAGDEIEPPPDLIVRTEGAAGGTWERGGERGRFSATELPGRVSDAYGCGDSFAAGLAYGLGTGLGPEATLELAARCGAACMAGRGPYAGQLMSGDLAALGLER